MIKSIITIEEIKGIQNTEIQSRKEENCDEFFKSTRNPLQCAFSRLLRLIPSLSRTLCFFKNPSQVSSEKTQLPIMK